MLERTIRIKRRLSTFQMIALGFAGVILLGALLLTLPISAAEYLRFLSQNGWTVRKSAVLKASFPLTYAECVKSEV